MKSSAPFSCSASDSQENAAASTGGKVRLWTSTEQDMHDSIASEFAGVVREYSDGRSMDSSPTNSPTSSKRMRAYDNERDNNNVLESLKRAAETTTYATYLVNDHTTSRQDDRDPEHTQRSLSRAYQMCQVFIDYYDKAVENARTLNDTEVGR